MIEEMQLPPYGQPPTVAEPAEMPPVRPTWALVIGVIAIVIASLGMVTYGLCAPAGTAISYFSAPTLQDAAQQSPNMAASAAQTQVAADYAPLTLGKSCVLAGLGIVLLFGGIGLLRMRPWARSVMLWWAVLRIVALVPGVIIDWHVQMRTFEAMDEAARTSGGPMPGMYSMLASPILVAAMVGFGLLFVLALPVFTLIWFNRGAIRTQMRTWR